MESLGRCHGAQPDRALREGLASLVICGKVEVGSEALFAKKRGAYLTISVGVLLDVITIHARCSAFP
jgi:hypothetical protein